MDLLCIFIAELKLSFMNRFLTSILFCLVFTVSHAQEFKTLEHTDYSIEYPQNWEMNDSAGQGMEFIVLSPKVSPGDLFRENVNLVAEDLGELDIDLEKYVELSIEKLKGLLSGISIEEGKVTKDYRTIIIGGEMQGVPLVFVQRYRISENIAYVLTASFTKDSYEEYKATAQLILESFKLK